MLYAVETVNATAEEIVDGESNNLVNITAMVVIVYMYVVTNGC